MKPCQSILCLKIRKTFEASFWSKRFQQLQRVQGRLWQQGACPTFTTRGFRNIKLCSFFFQILESSTLRISPLVIHMWVSMGQQLSKSALTTMHVLLLFHITQDKRGNSIVKFDGDSEPYFILCPQAGTEQQKQKEHLRWNKEWNSVTIIADRLVSLSQSVYSIE